jgi:hypothetical protein
VRAAFRAVLRPLRALFRALLLAALALFRAPRLAALALFRAPLFAALAPFRAPLFAALALFRAVLRPLRAVFRAERLADLPAFLTDFLAARFVLREPGLLADLRRGRSEVSDWLDEVSSKSNEREDDGEEVLSEGRGSIHPEPDHPISI